MDASERDATELRIEPEPGPDERAVLADALGRLHARAATSGRSGWWRAGVHENLEEAAGERPFER
jgi:hypothetical protein